MSFGLYKMNQKDSFEFSGYNFSKTQVSDYIRVLYNLNNCIPKWFHQVL